MSEEREETLGYNASLMVNHDSEKESSAKIRITYSQFLSLPENCILTEITDDFCDKALFDEFARLSYELNRAYELGYRDAKRGIKSRHKNQFYYLNNPTFHKGDPI